MRGNPPVPKELLLFNGHLYKVTATTLTSDGRERRSDHTELLLALDVGPEPVPHTPPRVVSTPP